VGGGKRIPDVEGQKKVAAGIEQRWSADGVAGPSTKQPTNAVCARGKGRRRKLSAWGVWQRTFKRVEGRKEGWLATGGSKGMEAPERQNAKERGKKTLSRAP